MSWKKKKKNNSKKFKCLVFAITIILILVLLSLLFIKVKSFFKPYYEIDSRVDKVTEYSKDDTKDYKTIGWIKVQGTNIDFPVIRGYDNSYEYPVQYEKYAWSMGNDDIFHNKINIVGHNIYNLSNNPKIKSNAFNRFEALMAFVYYDFAKDNKYIQLTIDGKDYLYKIFSVDFVDAYQIDYLPKGENTKSSIDYQLKLFNDNNLYDYDVDVNNADKFISLITCTRFFGTDRYIDFVVNGRLVRENEKINDYKVSINKSNYKKIVNILKGDGNNDENKSI